MRTFTIPGPPADLAAVKDQRGTVWIRSDYDREMFSHRFPGAETLTYRTWWALIEDGPLTEAHN